MKSFYLFFSILILVSCTKEVKIDIPGYQQQLVVEGRIESGGNPIVLLSLAQNIYSESYIGDYVNSFVSEAYVKVVVDGDTFVLESKLVTDFPIEIQIRFAEMLRLELEDAQTLPIHLFSTTNLVGVSGKTYDLLIEYKDKKYTSTTFLPFPTPLQQLSWKLEPETGEYGYAYAKLADPPNQYDAYRWESKRINTTIEGNPLDYTFRRGNGGGSHFSDKYFDGMTIDLSYGNPQKKKDSTINNTYKRLFRQGDSVVVKLSKLGKAGFEFYKAKASQLDNSGNPFATPINLPSNIKGGGLGIWVGYSPVYDTLYCVE